MREDNIPVEKIAYYTGIPKEIIVSICVKNRTWNIFFNNILIFNTRIIFIDFICFTARLLC